jgi:hypothetical protein
MGHDDEPLPHTPDLPLLLRSRMSAVLGLCFRTGMLSEDDAAGISREIATFKDLRSTLRTAAGTLLSAQAAPHNGPAWDVFQASPQGFRPIVIWAVQSDGAVEEIVIRPVGLRASSMYEVRSIDAGVLGVVSGATLMADGVAVTAWPHSAAHVLVLTLVPR